MTYEGASRLVLAYVANNNRREVLITSSRDGTQWSGSALVDRRASATAPAIHANQVVFAARDENGNLMTSDLDGPASAIPGQSSRQAPALFSPNSGDALVAYTAANPSLDLLTTKFTSRVVNGVWVDSWTPSRRVAGQSSPFAPALTLFGQRYLMVYVANNDSRRLLVTTSADGATWSPSRQIAGQSSRRAPSVTVHRGRLFVAYVANNDSSSLLVTDSSDGVTWSASRRVGDQASADAPAIASAGSELVIAHVAADPGRGLVTSASGDGVSWAAGRPIAGQSSATGPGLMYQHRPPLH